MERKTTSTNYENEVTLQKNCGVVYAFSLFGGRWKACILFEIIQPKPFGEIKKNIEGISERVLARQLKALQVDDLIKKNELSEKYELTTLGISLVPILRSISDWGILTRQSIR